MECCFGISNDVLLAIFFFKFRLFYGASRVVRMGINLIFCKKSTVDQIPKTASQGNKRHLLASNKGFLSGFITFYFYDKLLKIYMPLKNIYAAESPLRGAKLR